LDLAFDEFNNLLSKFKPNIVWKMEGNKRNDNIFTINFYDQNARLIFYWKFSPLHGEFIELIRKDLIEDWKRKISNNFLKNHPLEENLAPFYGEWNKDRNFSYPSQVFANPEFYNPSGILLAIKNLAPHMSIKEMPMLQKWLKSMPKEVNN